MRLVTALLTVLLLIAPCYAATYSGGDGSPASPYLISTSNDIQVISENGDDWDKHFTMTGDIDLDGIIWNSSPVSLFTGTFDGGGYVINNLSIKGVQSLGLFGGIRDGGEVKNLGLENLSITGEQNLGGICGYVYGEVVISNCYSSGTITGESDIGGLCGRSNDGQFTNCHSSVNIIGSDDSEFLGGLCGAALDTIIENCYVSGNLIGNHRVGGLCGYSSGQIVNSHSSGNVTGTTDSSEIGGLCGFSLGTISRSYSVGNAVGDRHLGGLCGMNYGYIYKSYSSGSVKGEIYVGGLCGWSRGIVSNCYSTGLVDGVEKFGGMFGGDEGSYLACFWDITVNPGLADIGYSYPTGTYGMDSPEIFAETTENMQRQSTFIGWDFAGENANGTHETWQISVGGYPVLSTMNGYEPLELSGQGTEANPYLISNANELGAMYYYPSNAHYLLTGDIDLSGITWGVSPVIFFDGSFDGGGKIISNLTIEDVGVENEYLGLFGKIGSGGQIKGLGVVNLTILGDESIGGICGINEGSIINCFSSGSITGYRQVAGICGNNNGSIVSCSSSGSITGDSTVGGICGVNTGFINGCDTTVDVTGVNSIGGFCASNPGTILYSSSSGNVIGDSDIGGFCGNMNGTISHCSSSGSVNGNNYVGGFCGRDYQSEMSNCYSSSGVTCGDSSGRVGGFLGSLHYGTVNYCYSTGFVITGIDSDYIGGFCGQSGAGNINNCYSVSKVTCGSGTEYVGGFCGYNNKCEFPKNFWNISVNPTLADVGYDHETGTYDIDSPDIIAETTENMQTQSTFIGWDFAGEYANGIHDIWQMSVGGYPVLSSMNGYEPLELSGEGTEANPYLISNANELGAMYYYPSNAHYLLTGDIDLSGITWGVSPVIFFDGSFDGGGYVISNLSIQGGSCLGLFGVIEAGQIIDLGLIDVSITGKTCLGGLCGRMGNANLTGCYSIGSVTGDNRVGGLCGSINGGNVTGCYSDSVVTANDGSENVGGLCGSNTGTIIKSYSNGSVTVGDESRCAGGLCGHNNRGEILNCYSSVNIINGDGTYGTGGLCGLNERGKIIGCYSHGSVDGSRDNAAIGGFCGQNYNGTIIECYSNGIVNYGDNPRYYGGFCGRFNGSRSIIGSFWDIDANPELTSPDISGVEALTALEMQTVSSFTDVGWDFAGENTSGTNEIWQMSIYGYPVLCEMSEYEPLQLSGEGTEDNPYLIGNAHELGAIYHYPSNACYLMTNDIDLSAIAWRVSPIAFFDGKYDGGGHVINNLTIEDAMPKDDHLSLFGKIGSGGQVKGLGVTNISITGKTCLGGLCGINQGSIIDCYSTGNITGSNIGGLCGRNETGGSIEGSYSTVDIIGEWKSTTLGGVCGINFGLINNCHSKSEIFGNNSSSVGGFCGRNEGDISYSNSSSNVTGHAYLGGFCGWNTGNLTNCSSTANLHSRYSNPWHIGGLCGKSLNGSITNCYSSGNISNEGRNLRYVGGLCGHVEKGSISYSFSDVNLVEASDSHYFGGLCGLAAESSISNSYSSGSVTVGSRSTYIGGLCGISGRNNISKCYSTCQVTTGDDPEHVGGLCGYTQYTGYNACFWDVTINPDLADCGYYYLTRIANFDLDSVYAKTTLDMQTESTFIDAGWDLLGEDINGTEDIWFVKDGIEYPRLIAMNNQPVADAGKDQLVYASIDGFAEVKLDGTGSYDDDCDVLLYHWYNDANDLIATGANPNVLLGVGEHVVTLTVNDGIEDSEPNSIVVTVVDCTAPVIDCPDDIATSGKHGGAVVSFEVIATDAADANPTVTTDIPSGSFFEKGVTTVTATATDASGNSSTCTFDVIVSCFGINEVKIKTDADKTKPEGKHNSKKGDNINLKGTFSFAVPIDLAIDDVLCIVDDGQGYVLEFFVPAGSFKQVGEEGDNKFKFHSSKNNDPDFEAKFDFDKCEFEFKANNVAGIEKNAGTSIDVILNAGVNTGQETVTLKLKNRQNDKHLEYEAIPKIECCQHSTDWQRESIVGDIAGAYGVDMVDLALLASQWANLCEPDDKCNGADIDGNGVVDIIDLQQLAQNWLTRK